MAVVQVRLLGPVDVSADGVPRSMSGVRRQALITALALNAGQVVSGERLIDLVWGQAPPATVANALQRHISYLRAVLGSRSAIVARSSGYVLDLGGEATDVRQAERLLREGRSTADPAHRLRHLQDAVALWRGPPLTGLTDLMWFDEQARRLEDLLLQVQQALVELRMALGQTPQVIATLEDLVRAHPLDEQIAGTLIRAYYGTGRQADALAAYQRLR
ncbi:MAG TPA: BTAD domain-containing putative transcriptional regulator, partial [Rugosimonospora sp.]|nr:BTAD domain-containing putative transcriptional regulator [Rugosimonospora sp.]